MDRCLVGRYYDPATGQFLNVDPLVDETAQAYAYTGDDPVNGVDPMGQSTFGECIGAQGSAGVVFGSVSVCIVRTGNNNQVGVTVTASNPLLVGATSNIYKLIKTKSIWSLFGGNANLLLQTSNADNVCELGGNFHVVGGSVGVPGLRIGFTYQHAGDAAGTSVYTYGTGYDPGLGVSIGTEYTAVTLETGAAAQAINKLFDLQESVGQPIMPIIA